MALQMNSPGPPDFLVVGAQRSGTTWLHDVLTQHPDLWLPPIKELHYFDRPKLRRGWDRWNEWPLFFMAIAKSRDLWGFRYLFGLHGDEWYASLFEKARAQGFITGEVAPDYATLGDDVYQRLAKMNPTMRIAFIMRDPVSRAWSAINRRTKVGRIRALSEEQALEMARSRNTAARACYMDTISRLEKFFPQQQLYFCFFDDLCARPEDFAKNIIRFLGADPDKVSSMILPREANAAATGKPIPPGLECALARDYLPLLHDLCDRFDEPPKTWRTRYEKLIQGCAGCA